MTNPDPAVDARAAIELRGISKRYGTGSSQPVTAAGDVSFTVEPGALVALTGASGSGKSTLLHLIGAIERPDSGTIVSGGTEVTALRGAALAAYRRTVGFVFQRYNLLPALTALDNVIVPDSHSAAGILDLLTRLRRENQMTVIIATHDPQIAARCDRLIRLRDGAVIDDLEIADGYPVDETIRRAGQLG
jgi:ABC-type lipoprotein export system ATPase subunit